MLSYRHAFHAGNHADVLKHCVLVQLLRYLTQKDKPLWFIDTHAGAGVYALDGDYARTNAEFETGIGRLWNRGDMPAPVADYLAIVRAMNPHGVLRRYPGSPHIASQLLRQQDRLRLIELHSTESELLRGYVADAGTRMLAQSGDGFTAVQAFLPPPSRRGLILVDPSYEDKQDYRRVIDTLQQALTRFAGGCYALWYPLVQRSESHKLPRTLKPLGNNDWLHVSLIVKAPAPGGLGLHGSGMFIIHPPFTLPQTLQLVMPYLVSTLGQDDHATYELEYQLA